MAALVAGLKSAGQWKTDSRVLAPNALHLQGYREYVRRLMRSTRQHFKPEAETRKNVGVESSSQTDSDASRRFRMFQFSLETLKSHEGVFFVSLKCYSGAAELP